MSGGEETLSATQQHMMLHEHKLEKKFKIAVGDSNTSRNVLALKLLVVFYSYEYFSIFRVDLQSLRSHVTVGHTMTY